MNSGAMTSATARPARPVCSEPLFIFAGGGSGGHLFPGLAIAERLRELEPRADALFLCSARRIDSTILSGEGVEFVPVRAEPLSWRPLPAAPVRFVRGWVRAVREARAEILRRAVGGRPVAVALMGGFVAAPVARATQKIGVPSVLVNLDVVPGKANRLAARFASRIVSAVPCPDHPRFSECVVGMPIRRRALAPAPPVECREHLGLDPQRLTLLVTGASQGAGTFNRLLLDLVKGEPRRFDAWQIVHLTGESDIDEVREAYAASGIRAAALPFLGEMGWAWGAADLALSRCGASSVAEALANRVPTLFSPYPWHRDQHQRLNAAPAVEAGLGWLGEDLVDPAENLVTLGRQLLDLLRDQTSREAVRERLRSREAPDAADAAARVLLEAAGGSAISA